MNINEVLHNYEPTKHQCIKRGALLGILHHFKFNAVLKVSFMKMHKICGVSPSEERKVWVSRNLINFDKYK